MRKSLAAVLTLLVLVPLSAALYLGWQSMEKERTNSQGQLVRALEALVDDLNSQAQTFLKAREEELMRKTDDFQGSEEEMRTLRRDQPLVRLVLLLEGNHILSPAKTEGGTDQARLYDSVLQILQEGSLEGSTEEDSRSAREAGWKTWYEPTGQRILFWRKFRNRTLAEEISLPALFGRLLGEMNWANVGAQEAGRRVLLRDGRGVVLAQQGRYTPPASEKPLARALLPTPFDGWSWEYYLDPALRPQVGSQGLWLFGLGGALLILIVGFLALYFAQQVGKEFREAGQRVNFVNQVSHELKTPLTNILLYADLLKASPGVKRSPQNEEYLEVITAEGSRLARMIHNVLSFSRQDKKDLPRRVSLDWNAAIEETFKTFELSLGVKHIELEWRPGRCPPVEVDPDWLGQILGNLISNAEKYGAKGCWIGVSSGADEGKVWVRIEDRGPGIPVRERERIFQPFVRLQDKITDGTGGAGLGLFIARDLARRHGGELILEETKNGASFVLSLKGGPDEGSDRRG